MIFWLVACALVAIVVVFALLPMMAGGDSRDNLDFARAFYREREAELKAQLSAGEIDQAAFDAALNEQARRLLAIARQETQVEESRESITGRRKMAALLMLLVVPVMSIGTYLKIGNPGMPDQPIASRHIAPKNFDIDTAIQKIEAHLAKNPDDGRGFEVVAPVYLKAGRFADAAHAYARVLALLGPSAARYADLGESLVAKEDGVVSADARQAFEAAIKLDPDMAKARFYLALAVEQDGKPTEALKTLEALRDSLPQGFARARVEGEIGRMTGKLATDEATMPKGKAAEALASLPENERALAIRGMVDTLEQRLFSQGGELADWQKLVRARLVLGDKEKAIQALEKAELALKDQPEARGALEALRRTLEEKK